MGGAIKSEISDLLDSDTFTLNKRSLPVGEIIQLKLACKAEVNINGSKIFLLDFIQALISQKLLKEVL